MADTRRKDVSPAELRERVAQIFAPGIWATDASQDSLAAHMARLHSLKCADDTLAMVLDGIREPSEKMIRAAIWSMDRWREANGKLQDARPLPPGEKHVVRWQAMLDALAKEIADGHR